MESLHQIRDRFIKEVDAISSQIEFVEESIILPSLRKTNNCYIDGLIPNLSSISDAHNKLTDILSVLNIKLAELNEKFATQEYLDIPDEFRNADVRSSQGECIEYVLNLIREGETDKEEILDEMQGDLEAACIISEGTGEEDFYLWLYHNKDDLREFIDVCLNIHHNECLYEIEEAIQLIKYYLKLFELIDTSKTNNIYRQGFIQLIALFDTIVFDCYREVFESDFFGQIKFFKEGKITFSELGTYQDFETLKSSTISSILKRFYLKDILNILKNQEISLFTISGTRKYAEIREMINRRNCHIHNNGIADCRYIESFNLFKSDVGDFLAVDKSYFNSAFEMCSGFVSNFISYFSS